MPKLGTLRVELHGHMSGGERRSLAGRLEVFTLLLGGMGLVSRVDSLRAREIRAGRVDLHRGVELIGGYLPQLIPPGRLALVPMVDGVHVHQQVKHVYLGLGPGVMEHVGRHQVVVVAQ